MKLLILKGFNNYFNRKIIKYDALADYIAKSNEHYLFEDINFNPSDGVTTSQVIGSENQQQLGGPTPVPLNWEVDGSPDYLIAYTSETIDEQEVISIHSRWFILESVRTRMGQYQLTLKRDSIADNFESLLNCPAYIKKGTVSDDNPLIVNDEGVRVNQIKTSETLLKDKTNSAWVIGYLSKDFKNNSNPDTSINVQVPDGNYESITIEDLALELDISASALESILIPDPNNQARFVNDNIEMVTYINTVDQTDLEEKFIARSTNLLTSFDQAVNSTVHHAKVSDCFCSSSPRGVAWATNAGGKAIWLNAWNEQVSTIKNNWSSYTGHPLLGRKVYDKLVELQNNKTLIYKAGLYYQVVVSGGSVTNTGDTYHASAISAPFSSILNKFITDNNARPNMYPPAPSLTSTGQGEVFINYNELTVNVYLTNEIADTNVPTVSVKISTSRNALLNQPFDMFAIPFNDTTIINGADEYKVEGDYAQKLAIALMAVETQGQIYDLQLLPYCPMPELATNNGINITGRTEHFDYDWVDYTGKIEQYHEQEGSTDAQELDPGRYEAVYTVNTGETALSNITDYGYEVLEGQDLIQGYLSTGLNNGTVYITFSGTIEDPRDADHITVKIWWKTLKDGTEHRSIVIYPKSNSFSVDLDYKLNLKDSMKIDSQTDSYRLVSPNYQGSFEFNVAKNGGKVKSFIADCTYKPYTPYIKVAPQFAWLYGTNFGDARGLICGGDFSIGFYSDRWQEYQLQNKNYQNIFNREIQNLDINQSIQKTQQRVSGGINILTSTAAGAGAGAMAGNIYTAIAGAAIGGAASVGGYAKDNQLMEQGLIEQRQFAIDKFNMQLENIQALPYTLTKVGAFNINSKIWPFLEYYTCTDAEKEALKMKIKYEGMTIGVIGYLGQYMNNGYLQADLIRNDEIIDDTHLLEDIYIELTKGVYI